MLTDDEVAAIRKRCEAATPGPMEAIMKVVPKDAVVWGYKCDRAIAVCPKRVSIGGRFLHNNDAAFIAAAYTDIPALLADHDELLAELANLKLEASVWKRLSSLYENGYGCDCPNYNDAEALPAIVAAIERGDFAAASKLLDKLGHKEHTT